MQQIAEHLATARERGRQLHARLVARLVDSATQHVQGILSAPSNDGTHAANTARRLRRDLRSLRAATEGGSLPADNVVYTSISRLQTLVEQLEFRADADAAFARDRLQEDLEGGIRIPDDIGDVQDDPPARTPGWRQPVAGIRRKVSDVGEVIEGRVSDFVRNDGTIDVDGLRGFVRGILDSIGMTWMRLNGRVAPMPPTSGNDPSVTVASISSQMTSPRDEEREFRLREEIGNLEKQLFDSSKKRENALRREDQLGKLMRAKEIRLMDDGVCALRRTLAVRVLQLELEKIFVGVTDEIDAAEFESILDQRVLVVEFGDLDERLATLDLFVEQEEPLLIEDDTVGELAADIQDLKMRLGLDAPLYSTATLNWDQVRQFLASSSKKTRDGLEFYSRGMRLFAGDVRFALQLVRRTMTGYTPSGREVRTLRRTGRDLLTLIPFTIVLIAPLSPVGHVLIFSFLQRYWPEFFPSTFSERRQGMMKKREQYLKMLEAEGEEEGLPADVEAADGGILGSLQRVVRFGVTGSEAKGVEDGAAVSGDEDLKAVLKDPTDSSGLANDTAIDERPVALSDLADSVLDRERKARKHRSMVALDELHLAD